MTKTLRLLSLVVALSMAGTGNAQEAPVPRCGANGVALQLLGSGGPVSDDARASSGAIIWINGHARILIDAGGGTYLRYGQSGARLEDLDFIGISHFHTDHSADLPAILKGGYFLANSHKLRLVGPTGDANFPAMTTFFKREFGKGQGAYAYLSGLSTASNGLKLAVETADVDVKAAKPVVVWRGDGVTISALGIPHGDVPTLAYRIETPKGVIVLSADQNGSRKEFVDFARGADILMMPAAIDNDADAVSRFMHATPDVVGRIAAQAAPRMLVLDHFMGRSLRDKDHNVQIIRGFYHGPVLAGRDLSCIPLSH
ncbi:MAG: MBL fold metallo-hydrolase [Sphingomonadales bacterium]|nr:MBL fold metallo-hydrolase [Sphingomonadales bacterium]MDE2170405.1 MBL fold metallo-hydrolase [Sphingomonadales bacterium]